MSNIKIFFRRIHLWLSLAAGAVILICCLTGALLVFQKELEQAFYHNRYFVEQGKQKLSLDQLVKTVKEHNAASKINGIRIYTDPERSTEINISIPEKVESKNRITTSKAPAAKRESRPPSLTVFIDPYNASILDVYNPREGFFYQVMSLHRWLLGGSDSIGKTITGISTLIFLFILITGIILWWPKTKNILIQKLKIIANAGWKRINHDLHNSLAIYALFFLLLMGLTGPQFSFEWYRSGLQKTLRTYKPKDAPKEKTPKSKLSEDGSALSSLSVADYIREADKQLIYNGNYNITLPADSTAVATITKTKLGFFAPAVGDRVTLDQYSGKILKLDIFKNKPFNERIAGSIKAIHVGNVYGTFTKWFYFLACLIATSLPISGAMIWLNKMKRTNKKNKVASQELLSEGQVA